MPCEFFLLPQTEPGGRRSIGGVELGGLKGSEDDRPGTDFAARTRLVGLRRKEQED